VKNSDWSLFYGCFHPKKEKNEAVQFEAKFPFDQPWLTNMDAHATYEASKDLEQDNPGHWDRTRLEAATVGSDLEKRSASTDWDWNWYKKKKIQEGLPIKLSVATDKNKFDKIMFDLFGESYEDDGTYTIEKDNKYFVQLKTLYDSLKDFLDLTMIF
jgi:hypothetical protein